MVDGIYQSFDQLLPVLLQYSLHDYKKLIYGEDVLTGDTVNWKAISWTVIDSTFDTHHSNVPPTHILTRLSWCTPNHMHLIQFITLHTIGKIWTCQIHCIRCLGECCEVYSWLYMFVYAQLTGVYTCKQALNMVPSTPPSHSQVHFQLHLMAFSQHTWLHTPNYTVQWQYAPIYVAVCLIWKVAGFQVSHTWMNEMGNILHSFWWTDCRVWSVECGV